MSMTTKEVIKRLMLLEANLQDEAFMFRLHGDSKASNERLQEAAGVLAAIKLIERIESE